MTVGFDKSAVDSGAADKSAVDKHTEELIDESLHRELDVMQQAIVALESKIGG